MTRPPLNETLITVVLPIYNEAHVLEELYDRVHRAVAACGTGQEIIFVNDGSTDASPEILDSLAQRDEHVRVIHLARNFGHQAAVHAGLSHALGDAVVLMDSDLQDAPEAIGRLVAEWITGYDVVYALRRERPEALWKRLLFSAFHRLLSRVAATRIPADAGNFSIIDARVVREIVALGERDRYLPGLRSWVGFKQRGVEVRRDRRYDGRPRVALSGLWRLAKTAIFSFSSLPLNVFYVIAYSALAAFVLLGGYALFCKLLTSSSVPGWTSEVLVASFFGAVNSLGICILGEYVIRIYDQVRGRPLYVVDQTRNLHPAADNHWPDDETSSWPTADRRTAAERRVASEALGFADRRAVGNRRAATDWSDVGADFGPEDYLAFAAQFDNQSDLASDDWRTDLETDEDYEALMAEAESLMALAAAATPLPKAVWPPEVLSTDPADVDPLNQDPLNIDALSMDQMWLVAEQSPSEVKRAAPDKGSDKSPADGKRSSDHKRSTDRDRRSSAGRGQAAGDKSTADNSAAGDRPSASHRQMPEAGRSSKASKTDRRGKKNRGE